MKLFYSAIIFFVFTGKTFGQNTFRQDSIQRNIKAVRVSNAVKVDGRLNEIEWSLTDAVSDFVQLEPNQGNPSLNKTEVKALFDAKYLYIGFSCYDTAGKKAIRIPDLKRDFAYKQHDMVAICIDGFNDKRNSITFAANAYGAQKDYLSFDDLLYDSDWNGLWNVRTSVTDSGWFAEFQIPWKTLRYKNNADSSQSFNINFLRVKRSTNEISVWSPYPRSFGFNRMEYAGKVTGLQPPATNSNIQINPFTLFSNLKTKGTDIGNKNTNTVKPGGEIKWAVTPNSVLDLTFNTDFAQADADLQVNNVSRFSVFFPEKRQFFLENGSLFGAGLQGEGENGAGGSMYIQPFFSRRIGLDESGNPIPITAGARFVNRSVKRSYGGIYIRQQELNESPAQNLFVGRYSENIGKANRIGGLLTVKNVEVVNSKNTYNNLVGAVDGFFRFGNAHSLSFMVLNSGNSDTKKNGLAAYAQYFYTSNNIIAWWTQSYIGQNFNPELGVVSRNDVIATTPGALFNLRGQWIPFKKTIRSFNPGITAQLFHQSSTGTLQERIYTVYPFWLEFQKGGHFYFGINSNYELIQGSFTPLGILVQEGKYKFNRFLFAAASDASKKISYSLQHEFGNYYNGSLQATNAALSLSPIPNIFIKLSFNNNYFKNVGQNLTTKTISLYTAESRFALNPRIQLVGLYQRNTQDSRNGYNVRFSWEYKPLSYIYFVYNYRTYETTSRQQEQNTLLKISYLKQF
ncbi:MAG: DUF5916 domain-containing protein [Sphingobacteriales bacterium]